MGKYIEGESQWNNTCDSGSASVMFDTSTNATTMQMCGRCMAAFYDMDAYEIHMIYHMADDALKELKELKKKLKEL